MASGEGAAVGEVRGDPRFARQVADETGYVPHTMLVVPLRSHGRTLGLLSVLDRRDGRPYGREDLVRAEAYAELAVTALDLQRRLAELETVTPE
jgi:GAF domain-containing protein